MTNAKHTSSNHSWARKPPPSRGPKPSLSPSEIAQAAIQIADEQGLQAVTMQSVAQKVGVTTMALYRYFPGKSQLLALMIDSAGDGPANFGRSTSSWKTRLKTWVRRCLAIYRSHPWFLEATSTRGGQMGPNELGWMEAALAMLAESGLKPRDQHHAFLALIGHVRGHATFQQIGAQHESTHSWTDDLAKLLKLEPDRYPALVQALETGQFFKDPDGAFDFGLDCILEGIDARVSRHKTRSQRR
ncbi:MAG: TetR/AcrR family transcriptional regulator [Terracidiphilus sp.]